MYWWQNSKRSPSSWLLYSRRSSNFCCKVNHIIEKTCKRSYFKIEHISYFILYPQIYKVCCWVAQLCPTLLQPHGLWPTRLLCPWDSPGKNTGVGCHFLLQGMFPTQGSNPGLLHCRQSLLSEPPGEPSTGFHTPKNWEFRISEFKKHTHFSPIWWPRCVLDMWPVELQNWILHFIYVFLHNFFLFLSFFFFPWLSH